MILKRKLFSDKKEKSEEEKSKTRHRIAAGGAVASAIGGEAVGTKFALGTGILDDQLGEDMADQLRSKLKIKKKGGGDEDVKLFEKLAKEAKKKGIKTQDLSILGPAYEPTEDVVLGLGSKKHADLLAHELGHRHYFKEKEAGKIGKTAHKIYQATGGSLVNGIVTPIATGITAGTIAGKRKARKEAKGEKESVVNKHAGWAVPIIATAPMLISEAAASRHGIKSLKAAGASKKYLRESRKNLATAFGTYATKSAMGAGIGQAVKEGAYRREKRRIEKRKEED